MNPHFTVDAGNELALAMAAIVRAMRADSQFTPADIRLADSVRRRLSLRRIPIALTPPGPPPLDEEFFGSMQETME